MLHIAHRGLSGLWGDNNMVSFQEAIKCGTFHMIEMDVQVDSLMIRHDMFGDQGIPLDTIRSLDIPDDMKIFFDLKGSKKNLKSFEEFLKSFSKINFLVCSFNLDILKNFSLDVPLGFITENVLRPCDLEYLMDDRIRYLVIHWVALDEAMIEWCHQTGRQVFTYTVNTKEELEYVLKFKVDGIISNYEIHKI